MERNVNSKMMNNEKARRRALALTIKAEALDRSFRRHYPSLTCYIDGERNISECKIGYYRDVIKAYEKNVNKIKEDAAKFELFEDKKLELY